MASLEGAFIEFIEYSHEPDAVPFAVPSMVRINGTRLLTSRNHPIKVHEMEIDAEHGSDLALVTLTLVAKRVVIGVERFPEEVATNA